MPRIVEIVDSTNDKQSRWLKIGNNSIIDFSRVQLKPKTDGRFDIWKYKSSCGNSGQKCITHQHWCFAHFIRNRLLRIFSFVYLPFGKSLTNDMRIEIGFGCCLFSNRSMFQCMFSSNFSFFLCCCWLRAFPSSMCGISWADRLF